MRATDRNDEGEDVAAKTFLTLCLFALLFIPLLIFSLFLLFVISHTHLLSSSLIPSSTHPLLWLFFLPSFHPKILSPQSGVLSSRLSQILYEVSATNLPLTSWQKAASGREMTAAEAVRRSSKVISDDHSAGHEGEFRGEGEGEREEEGEGEREEKGGGGGKGGRGCV